jgi:glycosyltransferase involved in cell wall biosynthesis
MFRGAMSPGPPLISVVIPTRDRHASLRRTIAALAAQQTERAWELVVVDDGSSPPVGPDAIAGVERARIVRREGAGPARARNAGLAEVRGEVVLFTDDDTEPAPTWIESAAAHLETHPDDVGVEGTVASPDYDPLYAHSLVNSAPGAYWTCNIGFRRAVLADVGGFSSDYPYPHCEDLDLAYRTLRRGPIGFAPAMAILHHPRPLTARQWMLRGRMTTSEVVLFERFRERFGRAARLPARLFPLASAVGVWRTMAREARRGPARRALRAAAIAVGYTATVAWSTLRPSARAAGGEASRAA